MSRRSTSVCPQTFAVESNSSLLCWNKIPEVQKCRTKSAHKFVGLFFHWRKHLHAEHLVQHDQRTFFGGGVFPHSVVMTTQSIVSSGNKKHLLTLFIHFVGLYLWYSWRFQNCEQKVDRRPSTTIQSDALTLVTQKVSETSGLVLTTPTESEKISHISQTINKVVRKSTKIFDNSVWFDQWFDLVGDYFFDLIIHKPRSDTRDCFRERSRDVGCAGQWRWTAACTRQRLIFACLLLQWSRAEVQAYLDQFWWCWRWPLVWKLQRFGPVSGCMWSPEERSRAGFQLQERCTFLGAIRKCCIEATACVRKIAADLMPHEVGTFARADRWKPGVYLGSKCVSQTCQIGSKMAKIELCNFRNRAANKASECKVGEFCQMHPQLGGRYLKKSQKEIHSTCGFVFDGGRFFRESS